MELQILTYDTYQHSPTLLDKSTVTFNTKQVPNYEDTINTVPVIRIFALVPETHTSCLVHIHNVFPYLYVHFPVAISWSSNKLTESQIAVLRKWLDEINLKLSESFKRTTRTKKQKPMKRKIRKDVLDIPEHYNGHIDDVDLDQNELSDDDDDHDEKLYPNSCYISDISIVSGTLFYGYYDAPTTFLKISMVSPKYVVRLSKLLSESKIFNRFIQPYESHIPYILQFLTDYNCYALKSLKLSKYLWRSPIIIDKSTPEIYQPYFSTNFSEFNESKTTEQLQKYLQNHVQKNALNPDLFPRIGRTLLEMDIISCWIENIHNLKERNLDKTRFNPEQTPDPNTTYISSTKSLIDDVENLRKSRGLEVDSSQFSLFDKLERNSTVSWFDQSQLDRQLKKAIESSEKSFKEKYKHSDYDVLREREKIGIDHPTSFQHVKLVQYDPVLPDSIFSMKSIKTTVEPTVSKSYPSISTIEDGIVDDEQMDDIASDDDFDPKNTDHQSNEIESPDEEDISSITNASNILDSKLKDTLFVDDLNLNTSHLFNQSKSSFGEKTVKLSQRISTPDLPFSSNFDDDTHDKMFTFNIQHPTASNKAECLNDMESYGVPKVIYPDPFFSKLSNYDSKPFIFAGDKFQLACKESDKILYPHCSQPLPIITSHQDDVTFWLYTPKMPTYNEVKESMLSGMKPWKESVFSHKSQIRGPTQHFKEYKYNSLQTPVERLTGNENTMVVLVIEVYVETRENLMPDPKKDEICAIFYTTNFNSFVMNSKVASSGIFLNNHHYKGATTFSSELDILIGLVSLVEYLDPDILAGLSRVAIMHNNKVGDQYGYTHASGIRITGRQMLNLWRRLRSELTLNHYSLENVIFHIFHQRIPHFEPNVLTGWWQSRKKQELVLKYFETRIKFEIELIEKLEIIEKVNEQSRLLGIDFYSIIYRGSQYMVECLLVRLAKAENFILISPSKKQVFKQDSLECIPLVMEPNSAFYKNPMVVLDFQSLYPSLIIAYNICYSTLLGRLNNYDPQKHTKMGVTSYKSPEGILKYLENDVVVTPNGMIFAKQNVRKSLLAKMLTELLNVRLYIKGTMSEFKDDEELKKLYNKRQIALKLIANVTYGYTSATYSGRMSNSDIADAIVSCARETLLKAVKAIEGNEKWGARVVYGDTDSLFVYLPGKTKNDAFQIGKEMAKYVTMLNPAPVTLKFEKVYLPSILISKKRYIGWKYEWEGQIDPIFDAKGIETVRRDGIAAQQKILEKSITILFKTKDISLVKDYVIEQLVKIASNRVNVKDFIFAKEVRVGTYKNEKYIPAGARLSIKRAKDDHRLEPQYKERVMYLVRKPHNSKEILRDKCVSPMEFLQKGLELDSDYYINKVIIPPLERVFNLLGVDVKSWVKEMPQKLSYNGIQSKLSNVSIHSCLLCGRTSKPNCKLCSSCSKNDMKTIISLKSKEKELQKKAQDHVEFCKVCIQRCLDEPSHLDEVENCCNEDCSVYYSRNKTLKKTESLMKDLCSLPNW
ncbi:hypothetical protein CANINC_001048 [Pichia inconspicua]|uniref:DNA polymerase n=1 Tax=Pichia inconspicua TaxID=52247 RepID=A0A4T0X4H7_9ASCO|nr:hypothetical protein CANINC_001048 [[Candida] inconspicua]